MTYAVAVSDPVFEHAEGPVWFADLQALRWVDMLAGDVVGFDPSAGIVRRRVGSVAAAMRPRTGGGAAIMLERSLVTVPGDPLNDAAFDSEVLLVESADVRLNEGGCDPQGRFICGSMGWDAGSGLGRLVRVTSEPTGSARIEQIRSGVTISNGIGFSGDATTCYYVDSTSRRIEVIEYGRGEAEFTPVRAIDLAWCDGIPDGLTVDAAGTIWVAMFGGGCVLALSPEGTLLERIDLPVSQVTACAFGDRGLDTLYITTSALGIDRSVEPLAGAVFAARTGAIGTLPLAYAG